MLPETSFHKFGENLMFAVINKTIYHTENSAPSDNFMYLCGLTFPLKKSEGIREQEKRYLQRNTEALKEFQNRYAQSVEADERLIEEIESSLSKNRTLHFFITQVIPAYCGHESLRKPGKKLEKTEGSIFENILERDIVVINKRVYPLNEVSASSIIRLNWRNYCFGKSVKTVDDIESEFQFNLQEKLKKEVLEKINQSEDSKKKLSKLEEEVRDLVAKRHIKIIGKCFEYGEIGYSPSLGRIYCFFDAHYNKTTNKSYKERQGAVSVCITSEGLNLNTKIIARDNESSDFHIEYSTPCLGKMPGGQTTSGIIGSLIKSAFNINKQKAFHE